MANRRKSAGELQARDYTRDVNGKCFHRGEKWERIVDA
jgi:hypothetical protein